jgi:hypothetical protein
MNRKISLFISSIFHPVFINLLSLILLFVLFPFLQIAISFSLKIFYILFIFITTGLLPVILVGVLKLLGKLNSVLLDDKDERTTPYIITACLYLFDYYFLMRFGAPHLLIAYLLACSCIVVAVLIINIYYKISIHSASLGALSAILIASSQMASFDIRILLALIILISGLTASARLFSNAHVPYQIYSGFFLGIVIMMFIL